MENKQATAHDFTISVMDFIIDELKRQKRTRRSMCLELGIDEGQFSRVAKSKSNFSPDKMSEMLNYLGYQFCITPIETKELED